MLSTSEMAREAASFRSDTMPSLEDEDMDSDGMEEAALEDEDSVMDEDAIDEDADEDVWDEEELLVSRREEHAVMERAQEMANKPAINAFI